MLSVRRHHVAAPSLPSQEDVGPRLRDFPSPVENIMFRILHHASRHQRRRGGLCTAVSGEGASFWERDPLLSTISPALSDMRVCLSQEP